MDGEIEELVKSYVKKFKKYQDDVEKEHHDKEATEKKVSSSLRDLTNLYQKAHTAQEEEWRSQVEEQREKFTTLESAHQQMEEKIKRMENNLQRKRNDLRETNESHKEVETKMEQLKLQNKEEIAALKLKLKEVNSSKKDVSRTLENLESENVKLKSDLKAASEKYRNESSSLKNDLQEGKLQTLSLEKRLNMVQGREKGLSEEVELKHKLTCDLSTKILDVENKCNQLSIENNQRDEKLKKQERHWQQKLKNADEEKSHLEVDKSKWEEKIRRREKNVQERLQDLESSNAQLATDKRKMEREANQRETELLTLVENIEAELVRTKSKTQTCEEMMMSQEQHFKGQIQEVEHRRCKMQLENDQLRDEMKMVKDEASKRVQEIEIQRHQALSELKNLKIDLNEQDQVAGIKIKKLESEVASHRVERVDLVKSCEAKEPIIEEKTQKIHEQTTTIGLLQERIKALDKQLSETITGKHNQLYKERKQMKQAEEEKVTELVEVNVALETKVQQLEWQVNEIQLQKQSLDRKITKQNEAMQQVQDSVEEEYQNMEEKYEDKLKEERDVQREKCELEEQVETLKLIVNDLEVKMEKRDLEIKEVLIKNMDLRTDLKHAKNKTSNEVVLFRSELRETKRKLQEAEESTGVMQHTEEKLKERIQDEQNRHSEMEQTLHLEIHQLKESNRQLRSAADDHETDYNVEMKQLTTELDIARRNVREKYKSLEEMSRREMEAQEKIIELEEEREEDTRRYKKERSDLLEEKKTLQSTLKNSKGQSSSETALLKLEIETLHQGGQRAEQDRERLDRNLHRVKEDKSNVESELERMQSEIQRMQSEMQRMEQKKKIVEDEMEQTQQENNRMKQEKQGMDSEVDKLKISEIQLMRRVTDLEGQEEGKEKLQEEISRYQNEHAMLLAKVEKMEKDSIDGVSDLEGLLKETRHAREELETEVNRLKGSEVKLSQTVTRLEEELDGKEDIYKSQIKHLQEEKKTLQSTLKNSKGQSSSETALLKLEIETLHQGGQRAEQDKEKLDRKLQRIEEDKNNVESELERLQSEMQRLQSEMQRMQSEMQRMEKKKKMVEHEMEQTQQENNRMKQEKQGMESEVDKLKISEIQLMRRVTNLEGQEEGKDKLQEEISRYQEENRGLKLACESVQGQSSSDMAILQSELRTLRRREEDKEKMLKELRTSEKRLKKQLTDLDVKNCQEKDARQQTLSRLEEENRNLRDDSTNKREAETMNEELREVVGQVETIKNNYKSLEEKEKRSLKRLREAEAELAKERDCHSTEMRSFSTEVSKLKREIDSLTKENKSLLSERCSIQAKACDFTVVSREKDEIQTRAINLEEDLKQVQHDKRQVEALLTTGMQAAEENQKTISDLRTTGAMLEEQNADLESLTERLEVNLQENLAKYQDLEKKHLQEKIEQQKTIEEMKQEIEVKKGRISTLEETKMEMKQTVEDETKAHAEMVTHLEEEKEEMDGDIQHWQEQSENYREQALQLAQQLGDMQTHSASIEHDLRSLKEKFTEERKDSDYLSQELASLVDKFEDTKATNFKLTSCLEKAIETGEDLKGVRSNLESEVNNLQSHHSVEKIKLHGMMSQQTKLIDYLQAKIEVPSKKKKKKLFGKSSKDRPAENMILPLQYKELQDRLEFETAKSLCLDKLLDETRRELQAVKSASLKNQSVHSSSHQSLNSDISMSSAFSDASTVLSAIVLSPSNQPSPDSLATPIGGSRSKRKKVSQNARASKRVKERMKHNIPHRFTTFLNMKPAKCSVCVDTIHFGRHASKCQECHRLCHPKCASALPHTCGLPFQFVRHFSEALHQQTDSPVSTINTSSESSVLMKSQGWMKVQGSLELGWDKKWVTLDGPQLLIFNRENMEETSKPWKIFDLQPKEGWVSVHAGIVPAELPNSVPSDLPFVVRLEHHMTSKSYFPSEDTTLYMMAPTFLEKQRWVAVLENVVAMNGFGGVEVKRATASINTNTLLSLEQDNKLDINCTMILNGELLLLGCDEGLYVMNLERLSDPLAQLLGVGSIYQMKYIPHLVSVVIIAGELRKLGTIDVSHLTTQAKAANTKDAYIKCSSIQNIESCHLFAIEEINNSIYLCAAQPQKIVILKYNYDKKNFVTKKEIPTAEPCSCLLFSQAGKLLAGMDRFYEVELIQFKTDEFLDSNDHSLAHAINSSSMMNSFPVAALQVASLGEREEYLLCFHEFALFVDASGKRTRGEDLQWSRLPLSVSYREPYLYITHFNCLEVLEIKPFSAKDRIGAHTFMELPNPRFTGYALTKGAVYVTSNHNKKTELICLQGNLVDNSPEDPELTIDMDDTEDTTPKAVDTSAVIVRRSSRIDIGPVKKRSLKRTLNDESDLSSASKQSRSVSNASSRDSSFRAAVRTTLPRRSSRLTSSSEDEVSSACGSVKLFTRRSNQARRLKETNH